MPLNVDLRVLKNKNWIKKNMIYLMAGFLEFQ